jgi:hypothetical protein
MYTVSKTSFEGASSPDSDVDRYVIKTFQDFIFNIQSRHTRDLVERVILLF